MTCPFCDFGAIVENDDDKEFRCQNKECQIVSCRKCRVESHIPLSCEGNSLQLNSFNRRTCKGTHTLSKTSSGRSDE